MQNELIYQGLHERILTLRSFDGMRQLDATGLTLLAEYARYESFERGEKILVEGSTIHLVHFVIHGEVDVSRRGVQVARVQRGNAVGVLSVLARDDVGVNAVATRDTRTLSIPSEVLLAAFEENFSLMRTSLRQSARGLLEEHRDLPGSPVIANGDEELAPVRERPLTLAEHVIAMRKTPLLGATNVDASIELARHFEEVRAPAGEVIWAIGDPSTYALRLDHGRVRCENREGESVEVGGGYFLGVIHALADEPRGFSAVASTDVVAYRTDLETILAVLESHHSLARDLQAVFAGELLSVNTAAPTD